MYEQGEQHGITKEKYGGVVPHQVPDAII